jgi:hypothetical protein
VEEFVNNEDLSLRLQNLFKVPPDPRCRVSVAISPSSAMSASLLLVTERREGHLVLLYGRLPFSSFPTELFPRYGQVLDLDKSGSLTSQEFALSMKRLVSVRAGFAAVGRRRLAHDAERQQGKEADLEELRGGSSALQGGVKNWKEP